MKNYTSLVKATKTFVRFSKTFLLLIGVFFTSTISYSQTFTNGLVDYGNGSSNVFSSSDINPVDGKFYCFWKDGNLVHTSNNVNPVYRLIRWESGTSTWASVANIDATTIPNIIVNSATSLYDVVGLKVDASGGFHVLIHIQATAGEELKYGYSANGSSWTWTGLVNDGNGTNYGFACPQIDIDNNNRPHVVYRVDSIGSGTIDQRRYGIMHMNYNGSTWNSKRVYFQQGGIVGATAVNAINSVAFDVDGAGKVHIAYSVELNGSGTDGSLAYVTDASGSWSSPVIIAAGATGAAACERVAIVTDASNKGHIVTRDYQASSKLYYYNNTSGSWSGGQMNGSLTGTIFSGTDGHHTLTRNSLGDLFFAYNTTTGGTNTGVINYACLFSGDNTWQTGMAFTGNLRSGQFTTVEFNSSRVAMILTDHFTDPAGTSGAPSYGPPNNSRQLQYITTTVTPPCTTPNTPGAITGGSTPCSGSTGNVYSISAVSGATTYTWSVPAGATITAGQGTTSATITFGGTSGNVSVTAGNACGTSAANTKSVTLNTAPATPGAISGTTTICSGSNNTYSISAVSGATSYNWTLPGGWSGSSTSNSISATANTASGNVSVTATNSCGTSSSSSQAITVNTAPATPGAISGTTTICSGSSNTYSIGAVSGATSYTWTLPGGWSGSSTSNSISATSGSTGGNVSVTATNSCGTSSSSSQAITVNTSPATPGAISGTTTICSGSSNTYSIGAVSGATSYTWTLPGGWSGSSTSNSISATSGSTGGNVSVTATNSCGTSSSSSQAITVNTAPATPGAISGTTTICSGSSNTYSIAAVSGATSYTWTLPGGWSGSSTSNSISATSGSTGGNVSVTATNSCGTSSSSSQAITVNTAPATPGAISGTTTICSGSSNTYSIGAVSGATSYTWTLPGGWSGSSTSNSINATANTASGNVSVTATNSCGTSSSSSQAITVNATPTTPSAISGTLALCSGTSNSYSVNAVNGATSYSWTLPSGWTGTSTTNSINVTAGSTGGNISVTATNSCGTSSASTQSASIVQIFPSGANVSATASSVCTNGSTSVNLTNSTSGINYYLRDNSNDNVIDGPVAGTGSAISFNTGTISGNMTYNVFGVKPSTQFGYSLPAANDYLRFNNAYYTYNKEITVEAWVNSTGGEQPWAGQSIMDVDNMSGNMWLWHAGIFYVNDNGTWRSLNFPALSSGWTHIATVASASGLYIYYNGALVASNGSGIASNIQNNSGSSIVLGNDPRYISNPTARNSNTGFSELRVWNVARSTADVLAAMNTCLSGSESGLVHYTKLNEGTGSTFTSGTGSNGANVNGGTWIARTVGPCASAGCNLEFGTTVSVSINTAPATPGAISGTTTICSGSSNTYSIAAVSGATSYTWTLPGGWTGTSTTNSISVTSGSTGGNISVTATNSCGTSSSSSQAITVNAAPATPGAISGTTTICSGSSNTYSIAAVSGATSYTWTLPGGWTGTSTTNSITTTSGTASGNVSVAATNTCGTSSSSSQAITVNSAPATPGTISGTATICSGSSNTYSITAVSGATSYTWTLPGGWTGTSTTNSITATSGSTGGNVSVTATNTCGTSSSSTKAITVNTAPATPGTISGTTTICSGSSNTYSVAAVSGATSYTWTLPGGWTGTSTTNTINVTSGSTGGNISVTATNSCGTSSSSSQAITVNTIPATPGTITGAASVCSGSAQTFSITAVSGATSYTWTVPSGSTINSGQGTASINVTIGSTSGNVGVTASNSCGTSSVRNKSVTITGTVTPSVTITGPSTVCPGANATFNAAATNGGTTPAYQWKVNGGNVGTNSSTYSNSSLSNGDIITCVLTSNDACASTTTATSNSITISVGSIPTVTANASPATTVCAGTLVNLSGSGATSYTWDNGVTDAVNFAAAVTTTYTVTGTNAAGCSNTAQITITVNQAPTVSANITSLTICNGASVTLAGTGAVSYSWDNSITDGVAFTPSTTTTYTVTGTDANGCTNTKQVVITVNDLPTVTANASATDICLGLSVTLTGSGATSYTWDNGITDAVAFTPTSTGSTTYTVTGTDGNGCTGTDQVTVNVTEVVPQVSISANQTTICTGESVDFTATPVNGGTPTYQWKLNGNPVGTNSATFTASSLNDGDLVTCEMTSTATCANPTSVISNSVTITVSSVVTPVVVITADDTDICDGNTVTFTAAPTGGGSTPTYQWFVNGSTAGSNSATYSSSTLANGDKVNCVLTTSLSCATVTTAESDTIDITVNQPTTSTITETACGSYVLNSQTYTTSGTYMQTLTNAVGCDSTITINLTVDTLDLSVTTSGNALTATQAGATYQWIDCNNANTAISGETNQTYTATANGSYAVIITNGTCSDTSACITVNGTSQHSPLASHISIYPNPTTGVITIDTKDKAAVVTITDMLGRELYKNEVINNQPINLNLPAAAYRISITEIKTGKIVHADKLVITR